MKKREGLLTIATTGFPPRIKYGVTPYQARGRLFFRGNDGEMSTRPRLPVMSGREACGILAAHGFVEVRRKGSHIVMQKVESGGTTTVPVPN